MMPPGGDVCATLGQTTEANMGHKPIAHILLADELQDQRQETEVDHSQAGSRGLGGWGVERSNSANMRPLTLWDLNEVETYQLDGYLQLLSANGHSTTVGCKRTGVDMQVPPIPTHGNCKNQTRIALQSDK